MFRQSISWHHLFFLISTFQSNPQRSRSPINNRSKSFSPFPIFSFSRSSSHDLRQERNSSSAVLLRSDWNRLIGGSGKSDAELMYQLNDSQSYHRHPHASETYRQPYFLSHCLCFSEYLAYFQWEDDRRHNASLRRTRAILLVQNEGKRDVEWSWENKMFSQTSSSEVPTVSSVQQSLVFVFGVHSISSRVWQSESYHRNSSSALMWTVDESTLDPIRSQVFPG